MKLIRLIAILSAIIGLSTTMHAKDANTTRAEALEKAKQEFVKKLGSQTGKINAKEIPQGFVFESGKGKVTLLRLWTKDCKSCIEDIPNLNRILLDFRGKVNIISIEISGMTSKELQQFAKDKKVLYTMISGAENKQFVSAVAKKFGFEKSLPFTVVLGYTGHNNGIIKGIAKVEDMEKFLLKVIKHYEEQKDAKQPTKTTNTKTATSKESK